MALLTPIDPSTLGLFFQLANGAWREWELGTRDGSSPERTGRPAAMSAKREFLCDWAQAGNATVWLLGDSKINTGNTTRSLSRRLPQPYPDNPKLIATSIVITGHKSLGQLGNGTANATAIVDGTKIGLLTLANTYSQANLEVTYTLEMYRADLDDASSAQVFPESTRYVSLPETRSSAEYGTMPAGMMSYVGIPPAGGMGANTSLPIPFSVGKVFPWEEFTVTWNRLPDDIWGASQPLFERIYGNGTNAAADGNGIRWGTAYLGTINKTELLGYPAWSLLFEAVRAVHEPSPVGNYSSLSGGTGTGWEWRLEYTFKYTSNPGGWNYLFYWSPTVASRSIQNGFYFVSTGNSSGGFPPDPPYGPGNLPDFASLYNERELNNLFVATDIVPGP